MNKFIQNFYNVIFYPNEKLREIDSGVTLTNACGAVSLIAVFLYVLQYKFNSDFNIFWFIFCGFFAVLAGLFQWLLLGLFIEFVAQIFDRGHNLKALLKLTAYAGMPFVFLAPIKLLAGTGILGETIAILLALFVGCYVIFLLLKSISIACKIPFFKAIMLLAIPLAGSIINVIWTIEFFSKLVYMCSM